MTDQNRREAIKKILAGALYAAPMIVSMSAPSTLMAQGGSGGGMYTICDYIPILCRIFGGSSTAPTTTAPSTTISPQITAPWNQPAPWQVPPPTVRVPPPGSR